MLETACQDLKKWLEQGLPPMRVAVNILANDRDAAIVKAIVTMAKGLNLTIVVEGVEEARQW